MPNPQRFKSIFTVNSASNELRVHTWNSYFNAWSGDSEIWPGSGENTRLTNDPWRWLTGMGTYTFRIIYPKYRSPRIFQIEFNAHNTETSHPHNEYLGYLGELGLIGLSLYCAMIIAIFIQLRRAAMEDDLKTSLLRAGLVFASVSLLAHQLVGVGVRYTGIGFQFWLTLGLLFSLSIPREAVANQNHHRVFAGLFLFASLVVMPNLKFPIQWMRSQHFYEMAQIHYNGVRNAHAQLRQQEDQIKMAKKESVNKTNAYLKKAKKHLEVLRNRFEGMYKIADDYFEAGNEYDLANFESIYIGANMNVQFARNAQISGEHKKSKAFYSQALDRYRRITQYAPYFVQVRYWQAVCHSGLAGYYSLLVRNDKSYEEAMLKNYNSALFFYDKYQEQDSVYREPYFEKYRIRMALAHFYQTKQMRSLVEENRRLGRLELKRALDNFKRGGYDIHAADKRFDAENLIREYMRNLKDSPKSKRALEINSYVQEQKTMAGLTPFLPKTIRHVQTALGFVAP